MYLLFALFLAFILIVWFDTDAFIEYAQLVDVHTDDGVIATYLRLRRKGSPQTFIEFIQQGYDNFLVRLITCPKCLSTWLGGLFGIVILIPAMITYGFFGGLACAGALPYLTYVAYQLSKKLK